MREQPCGPDVPWIGYDERAVLFMKRAKDDSFFFLSSHNSLLSNDEAMQIHHLLKCQVAHQARRSIEFGIFAENIAGGSNKILIESHQHLLDADLRKRFRRYT